jgi:hypothetical protein
MARATRWSSGYALIHVTDRASRGFSRRDGVLANDSVWKRKMVSKTTTKREAERIAKELEPIHLPV